MALNANSLKNLMKAAIDNIDVDNGDVSNDQALQALADAIVDHITTDARVIITGGSSSGSYKIT